jgi:hypothetical protein
VKGRAKDAVHDRVDRVRSAIAGVHPVEGAKEKVAGAAGNVSDATPSADDVRQSAQRAVGIAQENPLGLAVGAVALGFLAGMMVPSTRIENERIGPMADDLKDKARETGQQALERGREVAEQAVETVKEGAQSTASEVKETAQAAASGDQEKNGAGDLSAVGRS